MQGTKQALCHDQKGAAYSKSIEELRFSDPESLAKSVLAPLLTRKQPGSAEIPLTQVETLEKEHERKTKMKVKSTKEKRRNRRKEAKRKYKAL